MSSGRSERRSPGSSGALVLPDGAGLASDFGDADVNGNIGASLLNGISRSAIVLDTRVVAVGGFEVRVLIAIDSPSSASSASW